MDGARCDGWTKTFVACDRRRLLGALLGLALAVPAPGTHSMVRAGNNDPPLFAITT